ncbi:MAG: ABC transporter permease subunit [Acidobacteriota bacterium]
MAHRNSSRLHRARAVDRLVAGAITAGGSLILLAVAFLMAFLVRETLPLMRGAELGSVASAPAPARALAAFDDEYRENSMIIADDATLHILTAAGGTRSLALENARPPLSAAALSADGRAVAVVDAEQTVRVYSFRMRPTWAGGRRALEPNLDYVDSWPSGGQIRLLALSAHEDAHVVVIGTDDGAAVLRVGEDAPRQLALGAAATAAAIARDGRQVWIASERRLTWFDLGAGADEPVAPVAAMLAAPATAMTVVLGDVTCLVGDASGTVTAWQVVAGSVAGERELDRAGSFAGSGQVTALAPSERDKSLLIVRPERATVAHLTTRRELGEVPEFPLNARFARFSPRRDGIVALGGDGRLHRWSLDLRHPETSFTSLFLPVRYEGFVEPELVWQSTGGTSAFEPKLSLMPLLVGTFKGALFALLFSAPCGVAAALYVSQFAPNRLRVVAKPLVELMAALPSVVIGFVAALLLAPLVQVNLLGTLLLVVMLPIAVVLAAAGWSLLPRGLGRRVGLWLELGAVAATMAVTIAVAFGIDGWLESALFGGNFLTWLHDAGIAYDQRNALVVGFALGFAVIPIIFTLAEDAFSNVPPSLVSASLALGATRWQAASTVVVPAASPGLFAAVMTGLGRAVGETMIVLMATGNTPVLSLSPFNGMRTMSACIAVELPEAAHGDTLYRVLILTALLLFLMTFVINSLAVMVAARLRRRFGRLAA